MAGTASFADSVTATATISSPASETPPLFISSEPLVALVYQTFTSTHSFNIVRDASSNGLLDIISYSFVGAGDNEEHSEGFYQFPAGASQTHYENTLSRSVGHYTGWHTATASSDISCAVGNGHAEKTIHYHTVYDGPPPGPSI